MGRFYITKRVLAIAVLVVSASHMLDLDFFEYIIRFLESHEQWELDELFLMIVMLIPAISADYCWAVWRRLERNNKTLALANAELTQTAKMKDDFLAMMSHELRTPLNAILGMTEALQEQIFGTVTSEQKTALETIERSGTHLLALITDILDVAKMNAGTMFLEPTEISLASICQSCISLMRQEALKKSLQLHTHLPPSLPNVWGDEQRIRQVIINLLSNAIKFTPSGGQISLKLTIETVAPIGPVPRFVGHPSINPSPPTQWLHLAVSDTGIGIAPHFLSKLFEPFIQMDSALNRQYEGTGLGLALVKQIIELHDGQVKVTSEVGQGSCFTIVLPCAPSQYSQDSKPKGLTASYSLTSHSPALKPSCQEDLALLSDPPSLLAKEASPIILLAEDNEASAKTLSSYLGGKGYRMLNATNGREAVSIAQEEEPDVILMDIQMPEMDGLTAIQSLRASPQFAQVPIIALTALAMEGDRDRCLAAGANEYLSKPIKLKQLVTMIHALTTAK